MLAQGVVDAQRGLAIRHPDVDVQRARGCPAPQSAQLLGDLPVALVLHVRRIAEGSGGMQSRADDRGTRLTHARAHRAHRRDGLRGARRDRRHRLDEREIQIGLEVLDRRKDARRVLGEQVRLGIDEQQLLLDAERERRVAEPVPHAGIGYGAPMAASTDARARLVAALREHALVIGEVTLTSGAKASYYVDAKRAILRPEGFSALAELVTALARERGATAVGGLTMGADPVACAALAGGADVKAFFVRKEAKAHGLQRKIEGPALEPGDRCLVVEDVSTTGGSAIQAVEALKDAGHEVVGVTAVLDRLAGAREAIEAAAGAPYEPLTTIDDVYPERPDR